LAKFPSSVSDFICIVGPPLDFFFPAELVKVIEGVVPYIVDALKDTESPVRAFAVEALGEISKQRK